jgi:hypothetical protein
VRTLRCRSLDRPQLRQCAFANSPAIHARDACLLLRRNIFKKINAQSTCDMGRISVFIKVDLLDVIDAFV